MAEVFIGQIMMTGFPFAQKGFARCDGSLLSISQNSALFALLGTMYGGNGVTIFALPDLRGRVPVGGGFSSVDPAWQPSPYPQGEMVGIEAETLLPTEMPMHIHSFGANTNKANGNQATGAVFAQTVIQGSSPENIYSPAGGNLVPLANSTLSTAGANQPHSNLQPSVVINFNIATTGIWPSRN